MRLWRSRGRGNGRGVGVRRRDLSPRLQRHAHPHALLKFLFAILILIVPNISRAQVCHAPRTALVLSGGGAKGLVHVGVLEVLDSLNIRPDLIVGTSMGAIVGAMYASGYNARQVDSIVHALPLARLLRHYDPPAPRALDFLQPLIVWAQGERGFDLQSSGVRDAAVNALVSAVALRGNLLARGDFDSLAIPFRAVATNLTDRGMVVLDHGDLAQALRASFALPLIFPPERIDGRLLGDGGLVANVPVRVARELGAERVIVSDVSGGVADSIGLDAPLTLASHLIEFLFSQPDDSLGSGDVRVRSDVARAATLDFSAANVNRMIALGRDAARAALTAPACAAPPRPARRLPGHLARFNVQGGDESARLVLRSLLGFAHTDTIDVPRLAARLRALGAEESFAAVWLHPRPTGDSVSLDLAVRYPPPRMAGVGLAYDHELGGRAWLGITDHRLFGHELEGNAIARIGTLRQDLQLELRRSATVGRQLLNPVMRIGLSSEDIRRFDAGGAELDADLVRAAHAFAGIERAYGGAWWTMAGGEGFAWHDSTRAHGRAAGAGVRVFRIGDGGERLVDASASWTSVYRRVAIDATTPFAVGRLRVRPELRFGSGEELPVQLAFPLGGAEGFPGLHLGELRGDREAYAGVSLAHPLVGPLLVRVELAAGATGNGGAVIPVQGWLAGARAGFGLDTPVGPIRFEYGTNTRHRREVFVRVGRWF